LTLLRAKDNVSVHIGSGSLIKLQPQSLSNDKKRKRTQDKSYDILSQVVDELKNCPSGLFSIQLDQSTDVANLAQLLVYMRCAHINDIKTEFLFRKPLETTTTARGIFKKVSDPFLNNAELIEKSLCGVCTDRALPMS
jgi:hypothetical protein